MKLRVYQEFTLEFKDDYDTGAETNEAIENGSLVISDAVMRLVDEDGNEIDLGDDENLTNMVNDILMSNK